MAKTLTQMLGIGDVEARKLLDARIQTGGDLLKQGATATGRHEIAQATGLPEDAIRRWVGRVDLLRVNGVGPASAALLELAGITSVAGLAWQDPGLLHRTLVRAYLDHRPPGARRPVGWRVGQWVQHARRLPVVVSD